MEYAEACLGRALVTLAAAKKEHGRTAVQLEKKKDAVEERDAVIHSLKETVVRTEAESKAELATQAAQLEVAQKDVSALSEEKRLLQSEVNELRVRLAAAEEKAKASEAEAKEAKEELLKERAKCEDIGKKCAEVRDLVGRQREAHQAEVARLEKEKSAYGEYMYETGLQAGKDSLPEAAAAEAGETTEEELELNTCINLRWVVERFSAGYYDVEEVRSFLIHKLRKHGFDLDIENMHVAADEDEKEFCEGLLRRSEENNPDLPPLTEERGSILRRAYVNMILAGDDDERKELADVFIATLAEVDGGQHFEDMTPEEIRAAVKAYEEKKAKSVDDEVEILKVVPSAEDAPDEVPDPREKLVPITDAQLISAAEAKKEAVMERLFEQQRGEVEAGESSGAGRDEDAQEEAARNP